MNRWQRLDDLDIALLDVLLDLFAPTSLELHLYAENRMVHTQPTTKNGARLSLCIRKIFFDNINAFMFLAYLYQIFFEITCPPTCPLLSRYRSVWDHEDSLQGLIVESTVEKFTVFSLLWINFRIFHGRSLWLKLWNLKKHYCIVVEYIEDLAEIIRLQLFRI